MLYCGNNLARQPLQGKFYKLSIWEKFHFSGWIKIHGFFSPHQSERRLNWIWICTEFPMNEQKFRPLCLQLNTAQLYHFFTLHSSNHSKIICIHGMVYFSLPSRAGWFFYYILSFNFSLPLLVQLVTVSPLSSWLMFTGHSNTLNSLLRKGKMGALAGVRYCQGTEGAISMKRQGNLASVCDNSPWTIACFNQWRQK